MAETAVARPVGVGVEAPKPAPGASFPGGLAFVWALTLGSALAWSLFPEHLRPEEGAALYASRDAAAPTKTFDFLCQTALFFAAVVWPMLLLRRGVWVPRARTRPGMSARPPAGRPGMHAAGAHAAGAPGRTTSLLPTPRTTVDLTDPELPPTPSLPPAAPVRPLDGEPGTKLLDASIDLVGEEPIALEAGSGGKTPIIHSKVGIGLNPSAPPEPPDPPGRAPRYQPPPARPSVQIELEQQQPAVAIGDSADIPRPAQIIGPAPSQDDGVPAGHLDPRALRELAHGAPTHLAPGVPKPVGGGTALLQFVTMAIVAIPFFGASLWLSDRTSSQLAEALAPAAAYAVLHIGYAAMTRGWGGWAPDRWYILALLMLTLGWSWLLQWSAEFGIRGRWADPEAQIYRPARLMEQILGQGLQLPANGDFSVLAGSPVFIAALWPAALGLVFLVVSPLTARRA